MQCPLGLTHRAPPTSREACDVSVPSVLSWSSGAASSQPTSPLVQAPITTAGRRPGAQGAEVVGHPTRQGAVVVQNVDAPLPPHVVTCAHLWR